MYKRVLVPVDLGHGGVAAHILRVARWLAGRDGEITLIHVMDRPPAYVTAQIPAEILGGHRAEVRSQLEALAAADGGAARVLLVDGNAASEILAAAEELAVDAIVLGSHRPDYRDYLIGSTAARVVRHAACTVVVERSWASD
jgi:nucleotide-binding universal stress UspA family protein